MPVGAYKGGSWVLLDPGVGGVMSSCSSVGSPLRQSTRSGGLNSSVADQSFHRHSIFS